MSINIKKHNLLGALALAGGLLVAAPSQAYWGVYDGWRSGHRGGGVYIGGPVYYGSYYNSCGMVRGHWVGGGYWVPRHRVCGY